MKPILIFVHADCEPPGYLAIILDRLSLPYRQVCLSKGDDPAIDPGEYAGLVFMGGPGNVSEPEPWMSREIDICRHAIDMQVPVLGICLGAQMMTLALGGDVKPGNSLEVGWHKVDLLENALQHPSSRALPSSFQAFHWHAHECIPPATVTVLASSECTNCQAFALGPHLALQFHLEFDVSTIKSLIDLYGGDLEGDSKCVQSKTDILKDIEAKCRSSHGIADILMAKWFSSLYSK